MQPFEDNENLLVVLGRNSHAIVGYGETPVAIQFLRRDMNLRGGVGTVFDRIADQVLQQLNEMGLLARYQRQTVGSDDGAALFDGRTQVLNHLLINRTEVDDFSQLLPIRSELRIGEQVIEQVPHAFGALGNVAYAQSGLIVETASVAFEQKLRVVRDHAQRFLQIMAGRIGE